MEKPYKDIRDILEAGFLTHNLFVRGVPLTLRSLFPQEAKEILLQSYGQTLQVYKDYVVARSLYMVHGIVLSEEHVSSEFFELVQELPLLIRHRLYCEVQGLMVRYSKCFSLVEGFSFESESRTMWFTLGKNVSTNIFGHINGIQGIWQLYNIYEDMKESYEVEWNNTKFLGSAFSPKGLKKIYEKDKQQKRSEKSKREQTIRTCIAKYMGTYVEENEEGDTTPLMVSAKTEEELMEEYHRWVRGEKDRHDLIVDEYKAKIKNKMSEQKEEQQERMEALKDVTEQRGIFSATGVATQEQLEQAGFTKGVRTLQGESQRNRLYNRYLESDEVHGDFIVGEDGKVHLRS